MVEELPRYLRVLYPFKSNYLPVKGGQMHYVDEGEGPVVIMLHGNPTWSFYYRNLVFALKDRYRCIVPDHIGCGFSDKPRDFSYQLKDHIDNVLTLIAHLGIKKFHLVVHDWGGAIGMGAAQYHPENVGKMVITNTAAFRSSIIPWQLRFCRIPFLAKFFIQGLNGFALPATRMAVVKKMPREVRDGYLFPYRSWGNRRATYRFVQDIPMKPNHESYETLTRLEENMESLSDKKVGIFWGGKDFVFTKAFYEVWKKYFPKAESRYFEKYGHYLLEDGKDAIIEQIEAFLDSEVKPESASVREGQIVL